MITGMEVMEWETTVWETTEWEWAWEWVMEWEVIIDFEMIDRNTNIVV